MTAIDVCLQECSKNCVRTLWTRLKLRVLSHPGVCVHNLCSTLSERNIDSIRYNREMTAVHMYMYMYMHAHYKMCVDHTYHSMAVGP